MESLRVLSADAPNLAKRVKFPRRNSGVIALRGCCKTFLS